MQMFCLLLNALKKQEYQMKPSMYKNWNYLCEYINKHNCTILAEVIAVANKIERGLYDKDAMLDVKNQFENIELKDKMDTSFKVLFNFLESAISFFSTKLKPNEKVPRQKSSHKKGIEIGRTKSTKKSKALLNNPKEQIYDQKNKQIVKYRFVI